MSNGSPDFASPPVIETVIGVQFERLAGYSAAHAGWFWRNCLPADWSSATPRDVPRLDDQFEKFGEERSWSRMGLQLREAYEPSRVQIVRSGEERMIQIQDSRFIYNWQKRESSYPRYDALLREFRELLSTFRKFVGEAQLGEVSENQWEITYVDHIPTGPLWKTPDDWIRVLPKLYLPGWRNDSLSADWVIPIADNRGRIYVNLRHAKTASGQEVLSLQYVARGQVKAGEWDLESGLAIGHRSLVDLFLSMTSREAKDHWSGSKP